MVDIHEYLLNIGNKIENSKPVNQLAYIEKKEFKHSQSKDSYMSNITNHFNSHDENPDNFIEYIDNIKDINDITL